MNSSISNSEPQGSVPRRRTAWRIAFFLLLAFLAVEFFTRMVLFPRSADYRRFAEYPDRAERLVRQSGLRVALIGNSATDRGVDPTLLAQRLTSLVGQSVSADKLVADRASLTTWHYMMKRYFWNQSRHPDLVVINFFSGLDDQPPKDVGRLAFFFTDVRDLPDLFSVDLPTASDRIDFLMSAACATYAAHDRIKDRTLDEVVPDYKRLSTELNASEYHVKTAQPAARPVSWRALERFLAYAERYGTKICFVAYPPRASDVVYDPAPEAIRLIREAGMEFLDLRRTTSLLPRHYADRIHLTPEGAAIYSNHLAEAIAPLLR